MRKNEPDRRKSQPKCYCGSDPLPGEELCQTCLAKYGKPGPKPPASVEKIVNKVAFEIIREEEELFHDMDGVDYSSLETKIRAAITEATTRLEAECFALAATQCESPAPDEHGHFRCAKETENAQLRDLLGQWLALETRRNDGEGYSAPLVEQTRTTLKGQKL